MSRLEWEKRIAESLIDETQYESQSEELKEEGYQGTLAFGTAGIRGKIGLGDNRLNKFTVHKVAQGLAKYLVEEKENPSVVIAYDTRHLSKEFCDEIARVLGAFKIKTYIFDRYHTTPELSYSVRHLKTDAGVMITASHNPPEYNGIKIYGPDGGQLALEGSQKVSAYITEIKDIFVDEAPSIDALLADNIVSFVPDEVIETYKQSVVDYIQEIPESDLSVVFTSLHGTSVPIVPEIMDMLDFKNLNLVTAQCQPDPNFSSVRSANPEDHDAFDMAVELAEEIHADVLIATDPDADRMGIVERHGHEYVYFNGNQIGALLLTYIIENTKAKNPAAVKSIVTSELGKVIAERNNVQMFDVLTGFKFIAEKIAQFERDDSHEFIFGYEESYGYLAQPFVRDKDAVQIVPLVIKLASELKNQGKTLNDMMNEIYDKYGHYQEKLFAHTFEGQSGKEKIESVMNNARQNPPATIAGMNVIAVEDYDLQQRTSQEGVSPINLPRADVLKFYFEEGWVALRPSGTEPKIKLYISLITDDINEIAETVNRHFFG